MHTIYCTVCAQVYKGVACSTPKIAEMFERLDQKGTIYVLQNQKGEETKTDEARRLRKNFDKYTLTMNISICMTLMP